MSKSQMIEAIRHHNQTAREEFLVHFNESALQQYLRRLTTIKGVRGRQSVWVRPGDQAASITRAPRAA